MTIPYCMTTSSSHDVCKLKHFLYGLKQASHTWFEKFHNTLLNFSFEQSQYYALLFFHKAGKGIVLLLDYMVDIIMTGTDIPLITKLQKILHESFHKKDISHLTYILSLEVHSLSNGVFLDQHKYVQDLITLASLAETSSVDTPLEMNVMHRKAKGDLPSNPTLYQKLVKSLINLG